MRTKSLVFLFLFASFRLGQPSEGKERSSAKPIGDIEGYPVYQAVPRDAIAAIEKPLFAPRQEGDAFMLEWEPVLGLYDGKVAKAYSLWQLDHHEIVNDVAWDEPIAVTW